MYICIYIYIYLRNSTQDPNNIITHISKHKQQQAAPAKMKTVHLAGGYVRQMGGDGIGTKLPSLIGKLF